MSWLRAAKDERLIRSAASRPDRPPPPSILPRQPSLVCQFACCLRCPWFLRGLEETSSGRREDLSSKKVLQGQPSGSGTNRAFSLGDAEPAQIWSLGCSLFRNPPRDGLACLIKGGVATQKISFSREARVHSPYCPEVTGTSFFHYSASRQVTQRVFERVVSARRARRCPAVVVGIKDDTVNFKNVHRVHSKDFRFCCDLF